MKNELSSPLVNNGFNDDFRSDVFAFAKRTACQMLSTYDTISLWEREEIAENAAVDVLGKLYRFDPDRGVKVTTWAYKVVERYVLNQTQSLKRRSFYTMDNRDDIDGPSGSHLLDDDPDEVETNEVRALVTTTLNSLPRKARQVADLMQEGRSTEEITKRLQITDGALYAHTFRIRNEIDSALRNNGYREGPVRRTRNRGTQEGPAVLLFLSRSYLGGGGFLLYYLQTHLLPLTPPVSTCTIRESRPASPQTGTKIVLHFGHVTGMEDTVALSSMSRAMKEWPQCGQVTR